jgi:predicted kinase
MTKTRLILLLGLTGAGKTTYCDKLEDKRIGHVFSIDRWMTSLFWQDMPKNPDMKWFEENHQWYTDRISRCEDLIAFEVERLLKLGTSCILDLGFTASAHRKIFIELGEKCHANVELHYLNVNKEERWRRIQERNNVKTATYSMHVDEGMFNYMETIFENITEQEIPYLLEIS